MSNNPPDFGAHHNDVMPDFTLLTTLSASKLGHLIDLGHPKHRAVLALLLINGKAGTSVETLIDWLWGDSEPPTARDMIHQYVSELREFLRWGAPDGTELLPKYRAGGYRLLVDREHVDLHRFHDLCAVARPLVGHHDAEAVRLFRQAIDLWRTHGATRGDLEPLDGLPDPPTQRVENYRQTLREEYRTALLDCFELELRLGRHAQLISELKDLAAGDPPDERAVGLLMLALYRSNRQGDAMNVYHDTRKRLDEQIGSVPGKDLQDLHQRILEQSPALDLPEAARHRITTGAAREEGKGRADKPDNAVGSAAARLMAESALGVRDGGPQSWRVATGLFERVRIKFQGDTTARQLLTQLEESPTDTGVIRDLGRVIQVQMRRDSTFKEDIERMVDEAQKEKEQVRSAQVIADKIDKSLIFNEKIEINEGGFNVT